MTVESMYQHADPPDPAQLPEPVQLLLMVGGKWLSQCLHAAASLGVADLLIDGPRRIDELARATLCRPDALYRVLRALAAHGVFAELAEREFALTPLAHYLRTDVPGSVRHMAILTGDEAVWQPYGHILHTLRTGEPAFDRVHGQGIFGFMEGRPELARAFDDAMTAFSRQDAPEIAASFDFSRFSVIADIGGGHGYLLGAILRAYAGVRGILFDQPHVVSGAAPVLGDAAERVTCVGGDFFRAIPSGADAYTFKTVLHDWSDADAEAILANVRSAIGEREARLLLLEPVIAPGNHWDVAKLIDIEMLVNVGGRERTQEEWRAVLERAGFRLTNVSPTVPPLSIVEAEPV